MLKKGRRVRVQCGNGPAKIDLDGEVCSETPLKIKLLKGGFKRSGKETIVSLFDPKEDEILLSTVLDKMAAPDVIQLKPLGGREKRQFVRVKAWVELSHELLPEDEQNIDLTAFDNMELGQALPEISPFQMKKLAKTEEASEAVLYLIQAVQALDRKLEAMARLTTQLLDRSFRAQMHRQNLSISGSGLLFEYPESYGIGCHLILRVKLPGLTMNEIVAEGEVVRVDEISGLQSEDVKYSIACKFINIREKDREQIIGFAVRKQREALRRLRARDDF